MEDLFDDSEGVLDLLDNTKQAFADDKPKQEWKPKGEWKPNNGYKSNKPKVPSLWDRKDFTPKKIDVKGLVRTKSFLVSFPTGVELGEETEKLIPKIALKIAESGYKYRYNGDTRSLLQKAIVSCLEDAKDRNEGKGYDVEVYLPYGKFNENITAPEMTRPNETGYSIALNMNKTFYEKKEIVRAFMARDVHMVLGESCKDAVKFIVIYTPCGSESLGMKPDYKKLGDTVPYLRLAEAANIPVFNIKNADSIKRLSEFLKSNES